MPENTPTGWPYPVGTDRVMDGDDAIQALATRLDARLGYGVCSGLDVTPAPDAIDTPVTVAIVFPVGFFVNPPTVVVGVQAVHPEWVDATATEVTADGFTAAAVRHAAPLGPIQCTWIAHSND